MPYFASNADLSAADALDRWIEIAREEVDTIQAWRDDSLERMWHGGWSDPPDPVQFNTAYVCAWIVSNHPKLDISPLMEVANVISAWYADHCDRRIPDREMLDAILENALTLANAARFAILQRRVKAEPSDQSGSDPALDARRIRVPSRDRGDEAERKLFHEHPDLHALKQWAGGLEHLMEEFAQGTDSPDEHVWIVFRPTAEANTAIIKFSAKYPIPIGQLEEARKWTEEALDRLVAEENQDTRDGLTNALDILSRRAKAVVETLQTCELGEGFEAPLGRKPPNRPEGPQWDAATEARNKWIYDSCVKLTSYTTILYELEAKARLNGWDLITSIPGLKRAANSYAKRKQLTPPPLRTTPRQGNKRAAR